MIVLVSSGIMLIDMDMVSSTPIFLTLFLLISRTSESDKARLRAVCAMMMVPVKDKHGGKSSAK